MSEYHSAAAALAADPAVLALDSWQATQTSFPTATINSQIEAYYTRYLAAYGSNTAANSTPTVALPAFISAVPTSLQSGATSAFHAAAALINTGYVAAIAPSQDSVSLGSLVSSATGGSTGVIPPNSANATTSVSGSGVTPPLVLVTNLGTSVTANGSVASPTNNAPAPTATNFEGGSAKAPGFAVAAMVGAFFGLVVLL